MNEHNFLVLIAPSQTAQFAVLESEDKQGMIDELDFIQPELLATMKPLLYPIEEYLADMLILPGYQLDDKRAVEAFRNDGVTHIAVLSLAHSSEETMWLEGEKFGLGFMLLYCAAHNKYRLLHCAQCASCMIAWLGDMQQEWGMENAFSGEVRKEGQTYH